jgi:regulator of nucleoside diphosphate kinase
MSDRAAHRGIVYITEADLNRLRTLIAVMRNAGYDKVREYLDRLEEELDRAEIVPPQSIPHDVITMRSRVRLRDVVSGQEMVYSLVFPNEADFSQGKISVFAPIGTAMLGYQVGEIIEWDVPAGLKRFKVRGIRPTFRAGLLRGLCGNISIYSIVRQCRTASVLVLP